METLQEIKNTYAIEQGYADWEQLDMLSGRKEINEHIDEICIRAQRVALEKVAGNFNLISEYLSYNYTHFNKSLANRGKMLLQLDECPNCEEPLIFEPKI